MFWGDYTAKLSNLLGRFFAAFTQLYYRILYRPNVIDAHKATIGEAVIYVANHCGGDDGPFMLAALGKPYPRTLAAKEWYDRFFIHTVLDAVGCIPIDRCRPDVSWLRECAKTIRSGRNVLIFPEGTSTYDNEVHDFKAGFVLAAAACKAKIIPIWHDYYKPFRKTAVVIGDAYELSPDFSPTAEGFAIESERFKNIVSALSQKSCDAKETVK